MEHIFGKYTPSICFQVVLLFVSCSCGDGVGVLKWKSPSLCMKEPVVLVKSLAVMIHVLPCTFELSSTFIPILSPTD